MTQDEIIKMAREAGFQTGCLYPQNGKGEPTQLVYALGTNCMVEVEKLVLAAYAAGAAAEREACAKVCDTYTAWGLEWQKDSNHMAAEAATNECAAAIRARGAK